MSAPFDASDGALLRASATGDTDAYGVFVARHQAAVWRMLIAIGNQPADAEDALQETFLSAWQFASQFAGSGSARAWLLTIARRCHARLHRRLSGEPSTFDALDGPGLDALGADAGWGEAVSAADPLTQIADRELLTMAFARLSAPDREVLVLRDLEELSTESAAALLDIEPRALKSRLHRARLRLAANLRGLIDA